MNPLKDKYVTIENMLKEEEFKYWDAKRNGCSPKVLHALEKNIRKLEEQIEALYSLTFYEKVH